VSALRRRWHVVEPPIVKTDDGDRYLGVVQLRCGEHTVLRCLASNAEPIKLFRYLARIHNERVAMQSEQQHTPEPLEPDEIIDRIAEVTGLEAIELVSAARTPQIAVARDATCIALSRRIGMSQHAIAELFAQVMRRDADAGQEQETLTRTGVQRSIERGTYRLDDDPLFRQLVELAESFCERCPATTGKGGAG
jgi:hypothetical protein